MLAGIAATPAIVTAIPFAQPSACADAGLLELGRQCNALIAKIEVACTRCCPIWDEHTRRFKAATASELVIHDAAVSL
jgi:hypothetical protein